PGIVVVHLAGARRLAGERLPAVLLARSGRTGTLAARGGNRFPPSAAGVAPVLPTGGEPVEVGRHPEPLGHARVQSVGGGCRGLGQHLPGEDEPDVAVEGPGAWRSIEGRPGRGIANLAPHREASRGETVGTAQLRNGVEHPREERGPGRQARAVGEEGSQRRALAGQRAPLDPPRHRAGRADSPLGPSGDETAGGAEDLGQRSEVEDRRLGDGRARALPGTGPEDLSPGVPDRGLRRGEDAVANTVPEEGLDDGGHGGGARRECKVPAVPSSRTRAPSASGAFTMPWPTGRSATHGTPAAAARSASTSRAVWGSYRASTG